MVDFSYKAPNLGLDEAMVDFIFKNSLGSQLKEDLSFGFGSLRAIIFFLIVKDTCQIAREERELGIEEILLYIDRVMKGKGKVNERKLGKWFMKTEK